MFKNRSFLPFNLVKQCFEYHHLNIYKNLSCFMSCTLYASCAPFIVLFIIVLFVMRSLFTCHSVRLFNLTSRLK